MVAKPSGNKNKHVLLYPDSCFNLVAIPSGQPLALAAALGLATSTPLTEAGRKTQRALYCDLSVIGITALHLTNLPGCHMTSKGMDPSSGIFTAHEGGVYQISFTGLFHAENGHGVTADVVKKHANGDITHLGRSTADIDENSFICKVFPKTFETPF